MTVEYTPVVRATNNPSFRPFNGVLSAQKFAMPGSKGNTPTLEQRLDSLHLV
jgi:hypothetical protein